MKLLSSISNRRPSSSLCLAALSFIFFTTILKLSFIKYLVIGPITREQAKIPQEGDREELAGEKNTAGIPFAVGRMEGCDVFSGRWVYDEASRPLYTERQCHSIDPMTNCQAYGRPDTAYLHWRWQPHGCSLPSFNATFLLERLRGKRMLFVGDSLTRGQFHSMKCLLRDFIPSNTKSKKRFTVPDYNLTIRFHWAPFLVTSNCDHPRLHRMPDRIIHEYPGTIEKHAERWKNVDVMVFNTYAWWKPGEKMKIVRGNQDKTYTELMETEDAYQLVLKRMVSWLEKNMDPNKTRIFFTTMSSAHYRSTEWGGKLGGSCYGETTPIFDPTYWSSASSKRIMQVVREVFGSSKVPITILNITQLSAYRKDAHTSIYKKQPYNLTQEQQANPISYADCNHWCLPGVQDTWNELFYTELFFPQQHAWIYLK
ncbi:probable xylan O-acetyltransferase 10 [Elaeis guineensis]|uniref:Protein trichome birefringence-like 33 n=1 Tax=Elaeis guineensis var. tenera TaxID=51953 RepID=A0A6I9R7J1_ELAGV|nr:protein trichome birefringence-like 33 [Elaeis guineensis]